DVQVLVQVGVGVLVVVQVGGGLPSPPRGGAGAAPAAAGQSAAAQPDRAEGLLHHDDAQDAAEQVAAAGGGSAEGAGHPLGDADDQPQQETGDQQVDQAGRVVRQPQGGQVRLRREQGGHRHVEGERLQ